MTALSPVETETGTAPLPPDGVWQQYGRAESRVVPISHNDNLPSDIERHLE